MRGDIQQERERGIIDRTFVFDKEKYSVYKVQNQKSKIVYHFVEEKRKKRK